VHVGKVSQGSLSVGQRLSPQVDEVRRLRIMQHHSATHLMHAALQQILGDHVQQKGSLVAPDYLRFDFAHDQAMSTEEITAVENAVNEQIFANTPVTTELMRMDEAKAAGAMALFGERYDDQVRVLTMGQDAFSKELCGGTHVANTGQI